MNTSTPIQLTFLALTDLLFSMIATLIELRTFRAKIEIDGRILPLNQRALYVVEVPSV